MGDAFAKEVKRNYWQTTTAFGGTLISRVVAEYLAHRHRRDPEEVNARAGAEVIDVYKLQVRFVDESSRVKCDIAVPVAALPVGDGSEFIVDNREQSFERGSVALLKIAEQARDSAGTSRVLIIQLDGAQPAVELNWPASAQIPVRCSSV